MSSTKNTDNPKKSTDDKYKKHIKYLNSVIKEQSEQMITLVDVIEQLNNTREQKITTKKNKGLYIMSFFVILLLCVGIYVYLKN
jgi:hypothetical protein